METVLSQLINFKQKYGAYDLHDTDLWKVILFLIIIHVCVRNSVVCAVL